MAEKVPVLIVTFASTTQAIAGEKCLKGAGLPGRIIPVPRQISAACGLSWKAPPESRGQITAVLAANGLGWADVFEIEL